MYEMNMKIGIYPITVIYEHSFEKDPFGTGNSPKQHYIDVLGVYLEDSKYEVTDLFAPWMDEIEENILAEVA